VLIVVVVVNVGNVEDVVVELVVGKVVVYVLVIVDIGVTIV